MRSPFFMKRAKDLIVIAAISLFATSCGDFQSKPAGESEQRERENIPGEFPTDASLLVGTAKSIRNPDGGGYLRNQVYFSDDGGASWKKIDRPENQFSQGPLTMMKLVNNKLYLGNYIGISELAGLGASWEFLLLGGRDDQHGSVYDFLDDGSGLLLAATSDLMKRSADDGANWRSFTQREMGGGYTRTAYQVEQRGSKIFAATKYDIIVSDDDGATWRRILYAGTLRTRTDYNPMFVFVGTTMFVSSGTLGLYRSDDEGVSWQQVALPDVSPWNDWIRQIQYDGRHLYGIGPLGIYRSGDLGASWTWIPAYRITGEPDTTVQRLSSSNGVIMALTHDHQTKTTDLYVSGHIESPPGFSPTKVAMPGSDCFAVRRT